jgi:hypothetical protein
MSKNGWTTIRCSSRRKEAQTYVVHAKMLKKEPANERRSKRHAALHDLAEGGACRNSRQSRGRGRVRQPYAAFAPPDCPRCTLPWPHVALSWSWASPYFGCYNIHFGPCSFSTN